MLIILLFLLPITFCTPIWSQNPVTKNGWDYGAPPNSGNITFFCNTKLSDCPFAPPNSTDFVQFFAPNGTKGEYWISTKMEIDETNSSIDDKPRNYKLEILNFGIQRIIGPPVPITFWEAPWFAGFDTVLDDFWYAGDIELNIYPENNFTTLNIYYRNHTGIPKYLDLQYFTENFNGELVRVVFSGLNLYWI
jgi:hypothetical protein